MANKFKHLKEKSIALRNKGMTIGEICERVKAPKTTVYYWIKDVDAVIHQSIMQKRAISKFHSAEKKKWKELRDNAYALGIEEFESLSRESSFRDFVTLYMAEGTKKCENTVAACNSDPDIVKLFYNWIKRLAGEQHRIEIGIQYHCDQDVDSLKVFWGSVLGVDASSIVTRRKSNSGNLNGRVWRSEYGVLTVRVHDTYFRVRIQAWMDLVRKSW